MNLLRAEFMTTADGTDRYQCEHILISCCLLKHPVLVQLLVTTSQQAENKHIYNLTLGSCVTTRLHAFLEQFVDFFTLNQIYIILR
jgi:hypothetical protein